MLDSRRRGRRFEPHWLHWVVSLSKNINPTLELVQPRKTPPFIIERLSMGPKESNQIKNKSCWIAFEYMEQNLYADHIFRLENIGMARGYMAVSSLSNCIFFSEDDGTQVVLSLSNCHIIVKLSYCQMWLLIVKLYFFSQDTRGSSIVGNMSDRRYMSDYRSRGPEFNLDPVPYFYGN